MKLYEHKESGRRTTDYSRDCHYGSIIGIIEIPGIDIRYPVMEETGSEMLNAGTGNNAFYCQVQI